VSTAEDLAALVRAAHTYPRIREFSTATSHEVVVGGRRLAYHNTNALVSNDNWDIGLSKTGFINEAGRCLVMQAVLAGRNVVIVLLDSWGKYARMTDALRIRSWMEGKVAPVIAARKPSTNARTAQARTVNAAPRKPAANKPRRAVRTERGRHTLS
jgi:D-alanyl-D-alanine endopeptidase (penicillin-binding protein 7)